MKRATSVLCASWLSVMAVASPSTVGPWAHVSGGPTGAYEFVGRGRVVEPARSALLPSVVRFSQPAGVAVVAGAVRQPGRLDLSPSTTLRGAIFAAGGPSDSADTTRIQIIRTSGAGSDTQTVNLQAILMGSADDPLLAANDRVVVPTRAYGHTPDTKTALTIAVVFLLIIIIAAN